MWRSIKFALLFPTGVLLGWLVYQFITFPDIGSLRDRNPETTALIETRIKEAVPRRAGWRRHQLCHSSRL
jgi:hypothetical protein